MKATAKNKREKFELDIRPSVEFLGLEKVIDQIGKKQLLEQLDVDDILANLTPAKRRELQRRLAAEGSSQH